MSIMVGIVSDFLQSNITYTSFPFFKFYLKICSIQDTYEGRITELNNILRQSEKNREDLFAKFKTSEFTIQVGLDLDVLSFKIRPCIKFLDVFVKTRPWLMIV